MIASLAVGLAGESLPLRTDDSLKRLASGGPFFFPNGGLAQGDDTQPADAEVMLGASGWTASRSPIAFRIADKLLSAGFPCGESVR